MNISESVLKSDERVALRLRELYGAYGYGQYKMSKFEEYDLYAGNKDFLISDNVITFTDTNGKLMALKPDVTLSIVKNTKEGEGLRKVYYDENVYRISGSSRSYREIMQTGLECIGEIDDYAITEVLMLAAESRAGHCFGRDRQLWRWRRYPCRTACRRWRKEPSHRHRPCRRAGRARGAG